MIVIFGSRRTFKREGQLGQQRCPNCGHLAPQSLCRQMDDLTLFFVPIVRFTRQRGTMCEYCGVIQPLGKPEYKDRKLLAAQNS